MDIKGLADKAKAALAGNADKVGDAVDKVGDFIDSKTDGKFADKIDKVQEMAKGAIEKDTPEQDA
ncbi:MAG: antitoxin [Mycobacteriaceae bacterium]